jgi:NAD(P)-dependent dehydrogenase (short-subunit alcohol dehydrogenase family)
MDSPDRGGPGDSGTAISQQDNHLPANMIALGSGRIVNITMSLNSMIRRGFAPYGGAKASLEAHSAIMAADLEGAGVTVNALVPGGPAALAAVG